MGCFADPPTRIIGAGLVNLASTVREILMESAEPYRR